MTTPIKVTGAAYQSCIDEVLVQSPFVIDRWCSRLVDVMYERSIGIYDAAERHQIQNAIAALKKNRALIEREFPLELEKSIASDLESGSLKKSTNLATALSMVSFDQLELMGDSQVQEAVEIARLQQFIKLACEAGLAGFSARLSTAQGFLIVKADGNPMRPEIVAQTLYRVLMALPVTGLTRTKWLLDGAQLMGEELQSLYVLLNDMLAEQGIAVAGYGVVATPDARGSRGAPRDTGFQISQINSSPPGFDKSWLEPEPKATANEAKQLLTLDHLHRLLVGDYDKPVNVHSRLHGESQEVTHQDFSHTVPAALDLLSELEQKGLDRKKVSTERNPPAQSVSQMRAYLRSDAKSLGQSLAIEVVGLMIEQLAHDERLLPPVRQVIANAEPAFLRLAVTDPRFFSEKSHPARRLLESITSTSLGYASESDIGFQEFLHGLHEIAELLTEEHASDTRHFEELLRAFERKQIRNSPQSRQAQRRAVQALLQAEQRNLMAVEIAAEIRSRPDFSDFNRIITAFLTGPWSQVMARERLAAAHGQQDALGAVFSKLLDELLWSLDVSKTSANQKRLYKAIPDLLRLLRDGLVSIDYPLEQSRLFFDELMTIHQAGIKAKAPVPAAAAPAHTLGKMFEADGNPEASPLWLAPSEVKHSGFMDSLMDGGGQSSLGVDLTQPQEKTVSSEFAIPGSNEAIELHQGDWVELLVDMQWVRAQLTWVSPHNTLYMFTSEGGRKHSMTARVLRHLLGMDLVKVVSQQGLLDGALDNVARTAMRNSVQGDDKI